MHGNEWRGTVRRLLDPELRHFNKRGQILLIFGLIWVSIGFSVLDQPVAAGQEHLIFTNIPTQLRVSAWIVTGFIAAAAAFRPVQVKSDDYAFFALYIMPAERVLIFTVGYIDYHVPGLTVGPVEVFGTPGYSRGLYSALIWLVIISAVIVCSRWPDPPATHLEQR